MNQGSSATNALVLAALLPVVACRQERPPAPPAPSMDRPSAAIPADLDVALRFDLEKARRVFGPRVTEDLRVDIVDSKEEPGTAALLSGALDHATVLWVAFRPGSAASLTDNVLVLRGRFRSVDPLTQEGSGFSHPADLGGDVLLYERPRPRRRSSPSRIYAFGEDRLVFVSEAEIDAVERAVEGHEAGLGVAPAEQGLVSFAARPAPLSVLLAADFPSVAEVVARAESLSGAADLAESGLRGSLEARFPVEAERKAAAERVAALVEALGSTRGLLGRVARGARTEVVGASVVVRIALGGAETEELVRCVQGAAPC